MYEKAGEAGRTSPAIYDSDERGRAELCISKGLAASFGRVICISKDLAASFGRVLCISKGLAASFGRALCISKGLAVVQGDLQEGVFTVKVVL